MGRSVTIISVSIDPETKKLLDELSMNGKRNKSFLIREAIRELYRKEKKREKKLELEL